MSDAKLFITSPMHFSHCLVLARGWGGERINNMNVTPFSILATCGPPHICEGCLLSTFPSIFSKCMTSTVFPQITSGPDMYMFRLFISYQRRIPNIYKSRPELTWPLRHSFATKWQWKYSHRMYEAWTPENDRWSALHDLKWREAPQKVSNCVNYMTWWANTLPQRGKIRQICHFLSIYVNSWQNTNTCFLTYHVTYLTYMSNIKKYTYQHLTCMSKHAKHVKLCQMKLT